MLQIRGLTILAFGSCDLQLRFADIGATGGEIGLRGLDGPKPQETDPEEPGVGTCRTGCDRVSHRRSGPRLEPCKLGVATEEHHGVAVGRPFGLVQERPGNH